MRGILKKTALIFLLLVPVVLATLWLARVPLAEYGLAARLEQSGFPDASFRITELDWGRLRIASLALRPGSAAPTVARITVDFRPARLFRGDYDDVEVSLVGVRAHLVAGPGGPRLSGLRDGGDGAAAPPMTPARAAAALGAVLTLRLRDARITVDSPLGDWTAVVEGDFEGSPDGLEYAQMDADIRNPRLSVEGTLAARHDGSGVEATARLRGDDGFSLQASGRLEDPLGDARLRVAGALEMPAAARLPWAVLPGPSPRAGHVSLAGSARGRVTGGVPSGGISGWLEALVAGAWEGDYRVATDGLGMTGWFEGLDLESGGQWRGRDGHLSVGTDGGSIRVDRIAKPLWSRLPVPPAFVPYVTGPVRARVQAGDWLRVRARAGDQGLELVTWPRFRLDWPDQPGLISVRARTEADLAPDGSLETLAVSGAAVDGSGLRAGDLTIDRVVVAGAVNGLPNVPDGEFNVRLELPTLGHAGTGVSEVTLRLPMRIETGRDGTRVALRGPGRARAGDAILPRGMRIAGPLVADVVEAAVHFGAAPDYRARLELGPLRIEGGPDGSAWPAVELRPGAILLEGDAVTGRLQKVRLERFALGVPAHAVELSGLHVQLRPQVAEDWLTFEAERLARTTPDAPLAPIALSGRVQRRAAGLVLSGKGQAAGGEVRFSLDGAASADARSGQLEITVPDVAFAPGGLQPAAIGEGLAVLERVDGAAGGSVRLRWGDHGVDVGATVRADGLDFTHDRIRVTGLRGIVELDRLHPPRTPEPQRIEAKSIDLGLRIEAPALQFAIKSLESGAVGIHVLDAGGRIIEGTVAVRDWLLDPTAKVYEPALQVEGVSLGQLFEQLDIEGLEGSGRVSGTIPMTIAPAGIAVRDGRLRGVDGTLRYRSERAGEKLADTDPLVELMVRALEDFRYQRIEIGVSRELAGDSAIDIHMQGHNPDVLEGHPFDFNITLSGDLQPLFEALVRGRKLTDELIERHLRIQQ